MDGTGSPSSGWGALPPFLPPVSLLPPASVATSFFFSFFSFFCTFSESAGVDEDVADSFEAEAAGAVGSAAGALGAFSFFFGASTFLSSLGAPSISRETILNASPRACADVRMDGFDWI